MRLLIFIAVFASAARAEAYRRAAVAHPAPAGLTVDGALVEWNLGAFGVSPPIELGAASVVEEGKIDNPADHDARLFVAYGAERLYVAALVTDDHVVGDFRGGEIWRGDMIEVLIGQEVGYLHVGVSPRGEWHVFASGDAKPADIKIPKGAISAAGQVSDEGYAIELTIAYSLLGRTPKAGEMLAVNFAARDADPGESPAAHRTWSGVRHNARASFGELWLGPSHPPPNTSPSTPEPATLACPTAPLVRVNAPLRTRGRALVTADATPVRLKLVNFQSARANWAELWTAWDAARVARDLDLVASLGANAIRVFLFFESFGASKPTPVMLERLAALVDLARARGLLTVVSFFADKKDFRRERFGEMEAQLTAVTRRFAGDPAIAMWDLMNEPDHAHALAPPTATADEVYAWATHMAQAARAADPTHLVTIGLAGHFANHPGAAKPAEHLPVVDVLSLHWYFELKELPVGLARAAAVSDKPIVLQEIGVSSLVATDDEAAAYYAQICRAAEDARRASGAGLAGLGAWELFDHPTGSIATVKPRYRETAENDFGLFTWDGRPKAQARIFCECFKAPRLRVGGAPGR